MIQNNVTIAQAMIIDMVKFNERIKYSIVNSEEQNIISLNGTSIVINEQKFNLTNNTLNIIYYVEAMPQITLLKLT